MTRRAPHVALFVALAMSLVGVAPSSSDAATTLQDTAEKLYASLTNEQRKAATLPIDSPERTTRPGIDALCRNPSTYFISPGVFAHAQFGSGNAKFTVIEAVIPCCSLLIVIPLLCGTGA